MGENWIRQQDGRYNITKYLDMLKEWAEYKPNERCMCKVLVLENRNQGYKCVMGYLA